MTSTTPVESIAVQVARLLDRLIDAQRPYVLAGCSQSNPTFEASKVPSISLEAYVKRIEQYSGCTRSTLVAALVFIDRVLEKNPHFFLTERNVHRLLLACVVSALKFYEDSFYSNKFYARVGGISIAEMNALEIAQLSMISFDLFISPGHFAQYDDAVTATTIACNLEHSRLSDASTIEPVGTPTNSTSNALFAYSSNASTPPITTITTTPKTATTGFLANNNSNSNNNLSSRRGKRSHPGPRTDNITTKAPRLSSTVRCPQQLSTNELIQLQPAYQLIADQEQEVAVYQLHLLHKQSQQYRQQTQMQHEQ